MKPIYKIVFTLSMILTFVALGTVVLYGLRFGVDFRGGSLLEVNFEKQAPPAVVELVTELNTVFPDSASVSATPVGDRGMLIRLNPISEEQHQQVLTVLNQKYGTVREERFTSVGPTIGAELKSKSITAIIILLIVIVVYIALVFRTLSGVLSPWAMGLAAVVALIHDIIIPIGIFALLGHLYGVEISAVFVAAALTILGYSISDTVVVFDRVRENVLRFGKKENFGQLVHTSIMQTLTRSLNTTFTTLLSLIAIYVFGGESIRYFVLALIIGIALGAYSSIFIASPILIWWQRRGK